MGIQSAGGTEQAVMYKTGVLTNAAPIGAWQAAARGQFNISVWNAAANVGDLAGAFTERVQIDRSFDGGTTALPLAYTDGTPVFVTNACTTMWEESESGVLYRLRCTNPTAPTSINWRLSGR